MPYENRFKVNSKQAELQKTKRCEENIIKTSQFEKMIAHFESVGDQASANAIRFFAHQVNAPINKDFRTYGIDSPNGHNQNGFKAKSEKERLQKMERCEENLVRTSQFEHTITLFASFGDEIGAHAISYFANQVDIPINKEFIKRSIALRRMWLAIPK